MADIEVKKGTVFKGKDGPYIKDGDKKIPIEKGTLHKRADGSMYISGSSIPGSEELDFGEMRDSAWENVKQGYKKGAGMGAQVAIINEGLNAANKLTERGGYLVGDKAAETVAPYVPAEVAGGVGVLANMATQGISSGLGIGGAKAVVQPMMQAGGRSLVHSALKPNAVDIRSGDAAKAIDTLLEKRINITEGGGADLLKIKEELIAKVNKMIDDLPEGTSINKHDIADNVLETMDKFKKTVNSSKDIKRIKKAWKEFNKDFPDQIPIRQAQEAKTATYQVLGDKAYTGELKHAGAEGQKAIVRGLKEGIEAKVPGNINATNRELGDVINAARQVDYRVPMAANKNPGGLTYLATNPYAAGGMLASRSTPVLSHVGQNLYHGAGPTATALGGFGGLTANEGTREYLADNLPSSLMELIKLLTKPTGAGSSKLLDLIK